jgi:hypothetical protein
MASRPSQPITTDDRLVARSLRSAGYKLASYDRTPGQGDGFVVEPDGTRRHYEFKKLDVADPSKVAAKIAKKNVKMQGQRAHGLTSANKLVIDGSHAGLSAAQMNRGVQSYLTAPQRSKYPNSLDRVLTVGRGVAGRPEVSTWSGPMLRHPAAVANAGRVGLQSSIGRARPAAPASPRAGAGKPPGGATSLPAASNPQRGPMKGPGTPSRTKAQVPRPQARAAASPVRSTGATGKPAPGGTPTARGVGSSPKPQGTTPKPATSSSPRGTGGSPKPPPARPAPPVSRPPARPPTPAPKPPQARPQPPARVPPRPTPVARPPVPRQQPPRRP